MSKKIEMAGKKIGRLTVLCESGYSIAGNVIWKCCCDCGNISNVIGADLRNGHTKSCGCLIAEKKIKHGMSYTKTYKIWTDILMRCNNPNDTAYYNYGKRGIGVCLNWLKFENFFKDMGECPEGLTIERIDNDKGYYKENCCWASRTEQSRNQRIQKNNKTGIRGVSFLKQAKKYCVQIKVNYKAYYIGRFDTLEQAKEARAQAEQKYWL